MSALLGAYGVVVFLELTRFIGAILPGLSPVQVAASREMLVGLALVLVLRLKPTGLLPERIPLPEARMSDDVGSLLAALERPGQPETLYAELDRVLKRAVGHRLFTLLYVDGDEVARCYSNRPAEYPVSGRKPMGRTPWGDHVLAGRQPYLGRDTAAVRWAFFDHELIESMGLGSTLNVPVVYDGVCLGTINLLDVEHHYRPEHVPLASRYAPLLIPAFLQERRGAVRA